MKIYEYIKKVKQVPSPSSTSPSSTENRLLKKNFSFKALFSTVLLFLILSLCFYNFSVLITCWKGTKEVEQSLGFFETRLKNTQKVLKRFAQKSPLLKSKKEAEIKKIVKLLETGNLVGASILMSKLISNSPRPSYFLLLTWLSLEKGETSQALKFLQNFINQKSFPSDAYSEKLSLLLDYLFFVTGKWESLNQKLKDKKTTLLLPQGLENFKDYFAIK